MLKDTHLFQVGGCKSICSFINACFLAITHYFSHIIRGKLGSDVVQLSIITGDTKVSHTHPSGSYGTNTKPTEDGVLGRVSALAVSLIST